jgi:8-oxo-dGTP pyrophosphatase MutT (NUDIX family)
LEESLVPAGENTLRQAGAIVYRTIENEVRVLLVASRDTGRWVIPKGHIDAGLTPAQAAAREAYEEAGIKGTIRASFPLGFFSYLKKAEIRQGPSRDGRGLPNSSRQTAQEMAGKRPAEDVLGARYGGGQIGR